MRYQDDEAQAVVDDLHLAISLYADERTRTDLIPAVVVTHLAADELAALTAGTLKLKMGPNVLTLICIVPQDVVLFLGATFA